MIKAIQLFFTNFFNFTTRATRPEFWWFVLAYAIFNFILELFFPTTDAQNRSLLLSFILGAVGLLLAFGEIGLAIRRLLDSGKSGWNVLWVLLPIIGTIYFIILMCRPSEAIANRHGEPIPFTQK